ncbi:FecCD family ABC transporter permease [Humidisolicoccus flavus]|uniref:FecCD family ABC transporter permease n=1 Tax=Humidisolicoccus flavus TaxID=3111414 RepID=UPI00324DF55D
MPKISTPASPASTTRVRSVGTTVVWCIALTCLVGVLAALSMFIGSGVATPSQVIGALTGTSGDPFIDVVVMERRLPRTALAILVGAALAVAGAIIQALTRNPLADPGLLGVNAGAYLAVAAGLAISGSASIAAQVPWGLLGAGVAALAVFLIGGSGRNGGSPTRLVLAGVALGAVFTGVGYAFTLLNREVFDRIRHWSAGSVSNREFDVVIAILPFLAIGLALTIVLLGSLDAFALGEDIARSLGARVGLTRVLGFFAITALCGAATAAVGPIVFLGLMVPHLARAIAGPNQIRIVALALVIGPALLLIADILGRVLVPAEMPAGIVVAFLGAPVLIWVARRKGANAL